jgi:nucleoside-diphosphate-sugar epimerase
MSLYIVRHGVFDDMQIIIGCGFIGRLLGTRLAATGASVVGVVRSGESAAPLPALGIRPLQLDLLSAPLDALDTAGAEVYHLAPPPGEGRDDPLTARLIEAFAAQGQPRRLVYVGTTGVYGDCHGEWVDETRAPKPVAERSLRRWDAETRLRAWSAASGAELVILRVAGIYACDRLPLARIRSGQPVVSLDEAPWSNRIHADDLVEICLAAMTRAPAGALYNVCDGHPSTMTDYFLRIAEAAGLAAPPQIPLAEAPGKVSPGMLSYLRESRRLSNRKLLEELGVRLRYPTLADGLAACFPTA